MGLRFPQKHPVYMATPGKFSSVMAIHLEMFIMILLLT